eukprot:jgi/Chrzof1/13303/Cz07g28070.t1
MDPSTSLPFQVTPHDTLRLGLASLKEDVISRHPVEMIQNQPKSQANATKMQMMRDLYGIAMPAKMHIERQILDRFQRLPGLPSSKLGLDSLTGALDEFCFESYLGLPGDSEVPSADLHSQMETKLKFDTKPVHRGIV